MAVTADVSACSAMAENGRRSASNLPTSSAVRCWASAADPPLPAASSRCPARSRTASSAPQPVSRAACASSEATAGRRSDRCCRTARWAADGIGRAAGAGCASASRVPAASGVVGFTGPSLPAAAGGSGGQRPYRPLPLGRLSRYRQPPGPMSSVPGPAAGRQHRDGGHTPDCAAARPALRPGPADPGRHMQARFTVYHGVDQPADG